MPLRRRNFMFILIIIVISQQSHGVNLKTLRQVQLIYRHGDRAPIVTYPTDPYIDVEKYWPQGLGQLTNKGIDQQYDLGVYLRERYDGFIDRRYNNTQIHVLSSDDDRAILSATASLAGLYPKLATFQVNISEGKVDMQLVPVHTLTKGTDKLLQMDAHCPRRNVAFTEYKNTPEIRKIQEANQDLFHLIKKSTNNTWDDDFFSIIRMTDVLYSQEQHNLTRPSWATPDVFGKMRYFSAMQFSMKGATDELRRLFGGPLLKRLMENMKAMVQNPSQTKLYVHSGHDDTLAAVMTAMGIFDPQNPSYSSVLMIDLHQEESSEKYFVEIFYRNSTEQNPYLLQIPGCGTPCYLNEMETLMSPYIPTNWDKECQLSSEPLTRSETATGFSFTSFIYCIAGVIGFITPWTVVLCLVTKRMNSLDDHTSQDKRSYVKIP